MKAILGIRCGRPRRAAGWAGMFRATLGCLLILLATPALAQSSTGDAPAAAARPVVAPIVAADITTRADSDQQFVQAVVRRTATADDIAAFEKVLERQETAVAQLTALTADSDLKLLPVRRLESLQRHWVLYERQVADLRARLARATHAHSEDAASLAERRAAWQAVRAATPELAPALVQRIDELIALIDEAEARITEPLSWTLELGRRATALEREAEAGEAIVRTQVEEQDRRLLSMDAPPLWQGSSAGAAAQAANVSVRKSLAIETAFARDHDAANAPVLRVMAAVGLLLLPFLFWLKYRAGKLIAQGQATAESVRALTRPWAAWLVLLALGAVVFDFQGPAIRQQAVMLLAWLPVLRLLPVRLLNAVGPWAYLSAVFYFLNVLASLLVGNELVYRSMLLVMDLSMAGTLLWLIARSRRLSVPVAGAAPSTAAEVPRSSAMNFLLGTAAAVLGAAAVSNVLGNVSLATTLTGGVLDSSYLALALYAGATVLVALARVLFTRAGGVTQFGTRNAGALIDAGARLGRMLMAVACLVVTLQAFRLYRPLSDLLRAVLAHSFSFGVVSISLGNIAAFVAATVLAFWLARTLRTLLAEDILPSLAVTRGVGNSISTLSYYTILTIGLLTALAVLGFPIGQLAIVFGALGVGIGFGLQDVVKNFVAGLIMMFERPIQPGDVVEVAGMTGSVRRIGMRATIVTTFEGADVVVPNGMLLADKLINWTLRGTRRRVDIDVSTGPEVPPRRTIELLVGIARNVEGVASVPEPAALMTDMGAGLLTFSLRAWTTDGMSWMVVRSNLAVAVREGLAEAGIELPRPQSDLHLRSVVEGSAPRPAEAS
ncbi:mechanosensitive ion channel [Variovorax sp. J22P168]|uniref:mechanosensitive ion channel family protein n=1 Tax=Variovorax jilinensis TaxID=3053513 RepID=UPI002574A199|nr:mechanosensitive ion channel domain-containing protein [Variovorax sp. J22P168]MDM0014989.1 mechanosensitive ion channel [Variovorax sp. J22P168]